MPRYTKQNGQRVPNIMVAKAWIEIPVRGDLPNTLETYLVPTRVADYIVRLEAKIVGDLPKLPKK